MTSAVEVRGVSKHFKLYHERYTSLKERVIHFGKVPFDDFAALKDISFEVEPGTTLGLLGHNGSGKSTLLKCIAGILQPTSGEIRTRGRVAALLELGAGFHPDLTGRENVFLNASLLGMHKREIAAKFDDIVEFAELEPFIDNQVKYYSSGMYVRLGFAVAVNMDPEILIVDEVLAVGDELFQRKCIERVKLFQREGRTIIVVTHAADMVRQICDIAGVLDQGVLVAYDKPGEAVRSFREHLLRRQAYREAELLSEHAVDAPDDRAAAALGGDAPAEHGDTLAGAGQGAHASSVVRITGVEFEYPGSPDSEALTPGAPLAIKIAFHASDTVVDIAPYVALYDMKGDVLFASVGSPGDAGAPVRAGDGEFVFDLEAVPLMDGTYPLTVGLVSADEATIYDWREQQSHVAVTSSTRGRGLLHIRASVRADQRMDDGVGIDERLGA